VLAGIQIALVFVIMASAVQRLVLLTGESGYGLTTVRFYPMVFMIWLSVVFAWFAFTVFRGKRNNFAWGALWSAIVILGATNLLNPNAFIASTNVALMQQGREFDADYIRELGPDAASVVLSALPAMSHEDQCTAKWALHFIYSDLGQYGDVRSLNISRRTAFKLLRQNDGILKSGLRQLPLLTGPGVVKPSNSSRSGHNRRRRPSLAVMAGLFAGGCIQYASPGAKCVG
jgi:hypothetical protein